LEMSSETWTEMIMTTITTVEEAIMTMEETMEEEEEETFSRQILDRYICLFPCKSTKSRVNIAPWAFT
jgi:hypothetical protein